MNLVQPSKKLTKPPMKKQSYLFIAALLSASTFTYAQNWKIADGYSVKFDAGETTGELKGLQGTIVFDEKNLAASKLNVSIDPTSINTGSNAKNSHAKEGNWLDVEQYPLIAFTSSAITKTATGYEAKGILDLRGEKKEVVIAFTFSNNTFTGSFEIDRKDFHLYDWTHEKGPSMMKILLTVPVTR
jgi:polyisoprenoid-binding protein YceI